MSFKYLRGMLRNCLRPKHVSPCSVYVYPLTIARAKALSTEHSGDYGCLALWLPGFVIIAYLMADEINAC